jgi:hypothetical protein
MDPIITMFVNPLKHEIFLICNKRLLSFKENSVHLDYKVLWVNVFFL